ncbi:Alpha/Beta hydrolase protein [Penicillium malachiteum]|nr:Alpha/Beta hydrolase protein [Penicillium malachiteum]
MSSLYFLLYSTYTWVTFPARLIAIWVSNIPKSNRANPAWSYKTAVMTEIFRFFIRYRTRVRYHTPKSLEPGAEGDRFIVLNPQNTISKSDAEKTEIPVYTGVLSSIPEIEPIPIGAIWYPKKPEEPIKRLIIHLHSSAFVMLGARPSDGPGWGPASLGEVSGWPVLSIQYRLSWDKYKTFPAALQDLMTAYAYALETLKIPASQIVLSGESAGANLILALLRHIHTENPAIPLPRAALMWSPWVDMTKKSLQELKNRPNYKTDYLPDEFVQWGASGYIPKGWDEKNPYFTPLGNEYKLSVPIFIEAGTSEVLYDDIMKFAYNMKEKGNDVQVREAPNGPHVSFSWGEDFGMEDVARAGHALATKFIERAGEE